MPPCPGGRIGRGTLRQWREQLLDQGYSPSTVNTSVSAANSFLEWLGCREFQLTGRLSCGRDAQLELTRSRIPAPAVHRPGSETGAGLSADQAVHLHRIAGPRAGTGDGGGGGRGGPAPPGGGDAPAPARLPPKGAAGLRPEAGDLLRPHLCHPHRPPPAAGPGSLSASADSAGMPRSPRKRATRGACGSCITPPERRSRPLWPSWWSRPMSACWRRNRPPSAGAAVRR